MSSAAPWLGGEAVTENIISKLNVPFLILDSCFSTQCSLVLCLDKAEQTPGRNFHIMTAIISWYRHELRSYKLCGKQRIFKSAGECFTKNTLCIRFPKFRNGIKTQIIHWGSERYNETTSCKVWTWNFSLGLNRMRHWTRSCSKNCQERDRAGPWDAVMDRRHWTRVNYLAAMLK